MPKTKRVPPTVLLAAPGCTCGQCFIPVYVGPLVEDLLANWMPQISGVN